MNNGGDAAEQIVRLSLEGFEVAAKITGEAVKDIALLLISVLKQEQKTKGKGCRKTPLLFIIKTKGGSKWTAFCFIICLNYCSFGMESDRGCFDEAFLFYHRLYRINYLWYMQFLSYQYHPERFRRY